MANTINTSKAAPGIIAKVAAGLFVENLQFCKTISKADESDFNGKNGYSAGDTIQISKPARYIPTDSFDITSSIQDFTEEKTPLTLDIKKTIGVDFTSEQIAHDIALKSFTDRVIKPAVTTLAQYTEQAHIEKATDAIFNSVGTAGSTVFDTDTVLSAGQKINENACADMGSRFLLTTPAGQRSAVNARKGLFQSSELIAKQYKNGYMGLADGFEFMSNSLLTTHTNGNDVTGVAVNDAAAATGATTLAVDGLTITTGTATKGTVFTIAGVNAVHPVTKADQGYLQQFVVTADATANGSGEATLSISPTIYSSASGSLQNVTALPADNAALVVVGAADSALKQSLAYHKDAFRMASVALHLPTNAEMAAAETYEGVSLNMVRDFDILTRKEILRFDYLGGQAATRPEWGCRITA